MLDICIQGEEIRIAGDFDFGYMGRYPAERIHLYSEPRDLRRWRIVRQRLDGDACSDGALPAWLSEYFNAFARKIQANRKQVNDNFLIRMYENMEGCEKAFWEIEGLTRREFLPPDPERTVYASRREKLCAAGMAFWETPNDGSLDKPDTEALLRQSLPALDALLSSVVPEYLSLEDGSIAFQCSDGFDCEILCGAYDRLDERLVFRDWHNF